MTIKFEVLGKCVSKQRPRRGKAGIWYTPQQTKDYEREVGWAARIAFKSRRPLAGAVSIELLITESIPRSWYSAKKKQALAGIIFPKRGDLDNKIKSVLDGMNNIIYLDDRQINHISAKHCYGEQPKVEITVMYDAGKDALTQPDQETQEGPAAKGQVP